MILGHRRRGLVAAAALLWLSSIPVTLALASSGEGAPARSTAVAGAAAIRTLPPSVPARVDRMPRVSRGAGATAFVGRDGEEITAHRLARYLRRRGSPMATHASTLVTAGMRYGIDPRAIVAIAGVESHFGDVMPCFNAWGWGPNECRWSSWRQAIMSYARVVTEAYPSLRHGDFATASRGYNPLNAERWAAKCRAYFSAI